MSTIHAQDVKITGSTSIIKESKKQSNLSIKGTVLEASLPLPGVNVMLEGTEIGTSTNFDGNFNFPQKLKKGDVLIFTSVGMKSQKVVIENNDSATTIELKINMEMDSIILMGKVAVKEVYKSKK